jgi:7-keto-8-aminopelargonate synthetase-like enzyme
MKERTRLNHPPKAPLPDGNEPLVAPIYQSVKFDFAGVEGTRAGLDAGGYFYSRVSNPTTRQLELTLAQMQGRDDALVCASGVGAIAQTMLALLKQGDHVLCFAESYGPTRSLLRHALAGFGVTHTMLSIHDDAGIEALLATIPTRLVIFESPTNPINRIADIARLCAAARSAGALTVLDNTFAGPHQHGQYDVDLYLHSLTKYVGGHGDVLGGAVIGRKALIDTLRRSFILFGGTLDAHAAFLLQRGLRTYYLRYQAQSDAAMQLAQALASHPAVERVHYPGLPSHPRHALAREQMQQFGGVVSIDIAGGAAAANAFVDALQLFRIAPSMGSPEALVLPPSMLGLADVPAALRAHCGISAGTVRLSTGLDDAQDMIDDVLQALKAKPG